MLFMLSLQPTSLRGSQQCWWLYSTHSIRVETNHESTYFPVLQSTWTLPNRGLEDESPLKIGCFQVYLVYLVYLNLEGISPFYLDDFLSYKASNFYIKFPMALFVFDDTGG